MPGGWLERRQFQWRNRESRRSGRWGHARGCAFAGNRWNLIGRTFLRTRSSGRWRRRQVRPSERNTSAADWDLTGRTLWSLCRLFFWYSRSLRASAGNVERSQYIFTFGRTTSLLCQEPTAILFFVQGSIASRSVGRALGREAREVTGYTPVRTLHSRWSRRGWWQRLSLNGMTSLVNHTISLTSVEDCLCDPISVMLKWILARGNHQG